eukprot:gene3093-3926_t
MCAHLPEVSAWGFWGRKEGNQAKETSSSEIAKEESINFPRNVSGTYKGSWKATKIMNSTNSKMKFLNKQSGVIIFQLTSTPTKEEDVQYIQGEVVLREGMYVTSEDVHMMLEGVYIRPLGELQAAEHLALYGFYPREKAETPPQELRTDPALGSPEEATAAAPKPDFDFHKRCKFKMNGHLTDPEETALDPEKPRPHKKDHELPKMLQFNGTVVSENCDIELEVNTTSIQLQAYYNKAINYTLMVTCIGLAQMLLLMQQIDYTNTQARLSKVSLLTIGQQAIIDAYLCLLHLTVGIVMEHLFNAFATAAFFEFVTFSVLEMRYMLTIWKARQPANVDSWNTLRRELSILYSRFYGFLLGGIILIYQMQSMLRYLLVVFYSFWWPQIFHNAYSDVHKPLSPQYILGISATRLAIPLY